MASIAKQIADGSAESDKLSLDNTIVGANAFTEFVESNALDYLSGDIDGARMYLATVTVASSTVTSFINSMAAEVPIADWIVIDGETSVEIATGQFKDSNGEGLSFVSGTQRGVTDVNGNFGFELGGTVTFSIGGVTLGTTTVLSNAMAMSLLRLLIRFLAPLQPAQRY